MFSEEMICSLNDLELEVYKYVVRNADKVCYMRIREFADAAYVSTPHHPADHLRDRHGGHRYAL